MTNKLEIDRELGRLAEQLEKLYRNRGWIGAEIAAKELRALLATTDAVIPASVAATVDENAHLPHRVESLSDFLSRGNTAPVVYRQEPAKISIDRPWKDYPLGTKAVAVGGGHWVKNINGWKWFCGSTFPTPGGDARWVILPEDEQPAPVAVALPERKHPRPDGDNTLPSTYNVNLGWNACLDKVKELNQ